MADYKPFVERNAGDFITAKDWNDMQTRIRTSLNEHDHTGDTDKGRKLDGGSLKGRGLSVKHLSLEAGGEKKNTPDASMHITDDCILFGGANNGRQADSAQISAGRHREDSLCIVGMSDKEKANRKIHMWAEGGLTVNGKVGIGVTDPRIHLAIGDNDTGLNQQGDGELAIYANNAERMRVNKHGNVGIGTAAPKAKLHVTADLVVGSDINNEKFIFHSRTNGKGDFLLITSDKADGNWDWGRGLTLKRNTGIGINTHSPQAPLSIAGDGKWREPDASMHITSNSILFGGGNSGRQADSAQISAGKHGGNHADSLCIMGMSTGTDYATRKITMWAEGGLTVYGAINASIDQDITCSFGRAAIGSCGHTDYAAFAHRAVNNGTGYALLQYSNGTTFLNAAPGSNMHFRNGNADKMILDANGGLTIYGKINQEGWKGVSFQNGWTNYGGGYNNAGYFKDSMGIVHLRGLIKNGSANTIFTLPGGYRPAGHELLAACTNPNTIGRIDIYPDGRVFPQSVDPGWVSLDGLTFRAV